MLSLNEVPWSYTAPNLSAVLYIPILKMTLISPASINLKKVSKLFIGLYKAFFGPGIIVYLVLIIIGIIILIASKKLEKKSIKSFGRNERRSKFKTNI